MEAALVGVGTGVMKPLLSKLYSLLKEEHGKLKSVHRKVEDTRDEMRSMEAALEVLAEAEQLDIEMRAWRDDVRELSYDMEDCVDDFMVRADHKHDGSTGFKVFFQKLKNLNKHDGPIGFNGVLDKLKKLKPRHKIAGKIEELKARAVEASERHKRYKIDHPTPNSITCGIDPRLHALYVEVGKLVGIDGPKKHIIEWFNNQDSPTHLRVVSIVGLGGLGKTTLANAVFQTIKSEFSCAAFVSVSRKPNMINVLRDIAERLGVAHNTSNDDVRRLIDRLRDHLQDKKYLIVIDDIWSTEAWKIIGDALLNNDHGSRIITTTRNSTVASFCSSQGGYVYRMELLSFAYSRRLFLERAFHSEDLCPPHLKEVSERILEKCAGLPLAIMSLSSLLADQTAEEKWRRVLAAIGSSLAKEAVDMTKILSLSYFDLPQSLRTCLLYLSAFPEDNSIKKQSLIHKWIAEGFIGEEQGNNTYEVGEGYFNELINRSLIQPGEVKYGEVESCRVHDIILDFVTCKAKEENFMTSFGDAEQRKKHKIRRLSVRNTEMATVSGDLSHVRSLIMCGYFGQKSVLDFPALRVLDLTGCWGIKNDHVANIEKLLLLKYLRLGSRSNSITELPGGIGQLKYLETLDMSGITIRRLPSTMTRLQRLARLYGVFGPTCLSDGIIGQLQSLEELENVEVFETELEKFLQELGQLIKLRTLSVTVTNGFDSREKKDVVRFVGTLISLYNIHHLSIRCADTRRNLLSLELWCPSNPTAFRKVCIPDHFIDKVPNWMTSLGNLRELDLSMYRTGPEDIVVLGGIPALVFLKLHTMYGRNGRILIRGFRSLKYFVLKLRYCGTAVEFEEGSMPKLEHLELVIRAHTTECVNYASNFGIQHLSALTKVDVFIRGNFETMDRIGGLVRTALQKIRNRPTLSLHRREDTCHHFETADETDESEEEAQRVHHLRSRSI